MDISKIVIPEVPIPARILESKTASKKNQKKVQLLARLQEKKQSSKARKNEKQSK